MKDPEFFYNIVRPFLKSKIEKTVVDEFLLDQDLSSYAQPHSNNNLKQLLTFRTQDTQLSGIGPSCMEPSEDREGSGGSGYL